MTDTASQTPLTKALVELGRKSLAEIGELLEAGGFTKDAQRRSAWACPVARYLNAKLDLMAKGKSPVLVGSETVSMADDVHGTEVPLPPTVRQFIRNYDSKTDLEVK